LERYGQVENEARSCVIYAIPHQIRFNSICYQEHTGLVGLGQE
jgi:hypothetical protein